MRRAEGLLFERASRMGFNEPLNRKYVDLSMSSRITDKYRFFVIPKFIRFSF